MVKIIVIGCNGKMGKVVVNTAMQDPDCEVVAGIDLANEECAFPIFKSFNDINVDADVIIDFSHPSVLADLLNFAKEKKIPAVIATTGFSKVELEKIEEISKVIPVFRSANMSYEINLISKIVAEIATKLPDTDITELLGT